MNFLDKLDDIPVKSRVCLFGAGDYGITLFRLIEKERPDVTVVCFADTFKTSETCNIKTLSPQSLLNIEFDLVIISSHLFVESITNELKRVGIKNYFGLNPLFNSKYAKSSYFEHDEHHFDDVLYAFYDFAVSPHGFDFVHFLYLAEIERRKRGYAKLHPVLVPAPNDVLLNKDATFEDGMSSRVPFSVTNDWWYRNIIIASTWLAESCNQVTVCNSREEAWAIFQRAKGIYPNHYTPNHPVQGYSDTLLIKALLNTPDLPSLTATPMALSFIDQWIKVHEAGRKLVTITLRESPFGYCSEKNSTIPVWVEFAKQLDLNEYCPVFVRDTSVAMDTLPTELSDALICHEAPWNLDIRMALYQRGYINMFVGNGPGMLSLLNRENRVLMFWRGESGSGNVVAKNQLIIAGLPPGQTYPNPGKYQRVIFVNIDQLDVLTNEFNALCSTIENTTAS